MGWGSQQEVKMSEKKELEDAGHWEIFETTQCLLSVFLQRSHLTLEKDSIVWASSEGFLSEDVEGQLVARPCCEAPQEDNISRSLVWPQFPFQQNDQLCDWAACRPAFWLLISHPDTALSLTFLTVLFITISPENLALSFGVVLLMTNGTFHTLIVQDLLFFSPPFLISVHLEFTWTRARQAHSPTLLKSVMLPVSAQFGQERGYIALLCFECWSHEPLSIKNDGVCMRLKMDNLLSVIWSTRQF